MNFFQLPIGAGPNDPVVGEVDGAQIRRAPNGTKYYSQYRAPAAPAAPSMMTETTLDSQGRAIHNRVQNTTRDQVRAILAGPSAIAGEAVRGLTAPGRALRGEPVTYGDAWATALDYGVGSAPTSAPDGALRAGPFRAYHSSRSDFDKFDTSKGGRGASFFAASPEQARRGAVAGQNELARHASPTPDARPNIMYSVDIESSGIRGMDLSPSELEWWKSLPKEMSFSQFDEALASAPTEKLRQKWYYFFDESPSDPQKAAAIKASDYAEIDRLGGISDDDMVYRKGDAPPSKSYEEIQRTGRDVYGDQIAHYGPGSDEAAIAERVKSDGMGGYLIADEGGYSVAVSDPDLISIVRKYGIAGAAAYLGMPEDEIRQRVGGS